MSAPLTDSAKAGAGVVLGLILAGLAASGGLYLVAQGGWTPSEAAAGHVVVGWGTCTSVDGGGSSCTCTPGAWIQSPGPDGGGAQCVAPVGAVVLHATARVSDSTAAAFGVGPTDAGYSYFYCNVVAVPVDGGVDPGPDVVPGATVVYDLDTIDATDAGLPQLECWRQGRADAPFSCACSSGPTCLQPDGGAAPTGITLQPGAFVAGAGCLPKACIELAGSDSWPHDRCPP